MSHSDERERKRLRTAAFQKVSQSRVSTLAGGPFECEAAVTFQALLVSHTPVRAAESVGAAVMGMITLGLYELRTSTRAHVHAQTNTHMKKKQET